jgi:hypothetical protein
MRRREGREGSIFVYYSKKGGDDARRRVGASKGWHIVFNTSRNFLTYYRVLSALNEDVPTPQ